MEVTVISRETIAPSFSSSSPKSTLRRDGPKPFRISLLDQVTPDTFFPFIFFFESPQNAGDVVPFATRLKSSLSHALSRFYPFAGVVKSNVVVDDFQNGVPFLEARVSVKMSTFLSGPKTASLNEFLPCMPFRKPDAPTRLLAVQLSEFRCGGVAVGLCASHKIADAACVVSFLDTWASLTRRQDRAPPNDGVLGGEPNDLSLRLRFPLENDGVLGGEPNDLSLRLRFPLENDGVLVDELNDLSLRIPVKGRVSRTREYENENDGVFDDDLTDLSFRFPPVDPVPVFYTSIYESLWFSTGDFRTERFVFAAEALAGLADRATTDQQRVENTRPTRVQALTGFIWRAAMSASRSLDPSPRTVLACQAVNLRRKGDPRRRVGNEFWWSVAVHNDESASAEERSLPTITESLTLSVSETREYYSSLRRGEEAYAAIGDHFRLLEELYAVEEPEIYGFTSWVNMGLDEVDFGLGRAVWAGTFGEVGPEFRNLVVLKDETTKGGGIEAWLTLEDKVLTQLMDDPDFLALASVDPPIIIHNN